MNGRVAKEIRGIANGLTTGKPYRKYQHKPALAASGRPSNSPSATIILGDCTRRTYKALKRVYKQSGSKIHDGQLNLRSQGNPETV